MVREVRAVASHLRELRQEAERQGWRIVARKGHEQWYSPDGVTIATVPFASAGRIKEHGRYVKNLKAQLKKGGLR